jgi:hypothetical protein
MKNGLRQAQAPQISNEELMLIMKNVNLLKDDVEIN